MKSLASAEVLSETRERMLRVCAADRAIWGRMSAPQMMRHLGCACEVALGERSAEMIQIPARGIVKFVALRSGLPWKQNIKTTPGLVRALEEEFTSDFVELAGFAVAKMEALAGCRHCVAVHSIFGPMSMEDWMRWGYLHTDHHLRQFGR